MHKHLSTLCLIVLSALPGPGVFASEVIGEIRMARGDASVQRAGKPMPATRGMSIQRADVLTTGADGRIAIVFADDSRFSLGGNGRLALDRFEFDKASGRGALEVRMDAGSLAVSTGRISKNSPDALKVRTPTTILGARGTEFIVEVGD